MRGSFSLLFSLAVRNLKFQSFNNWIYATKSSDKEFVLDFIKELIELLALSSGLYFIKAQPIKRNIS